MACCIVPLQRWATVIRDFAASGNLLDLTVAIVIGNAFTELIKALIDKLITPILGFLFNGINIAPLNASLKSDRWPHKPPVILPYGEFLQQVIYFAAIAISLSLIIMIINKIFRARQRRQVNSEQ
jgi:large conductance mechanosensitive channel